MPIESLKELLKSVVPGGRVKIDAGEIGEGYRPIELIEKVLPKIVPFHYTALIEEGTDLVVIKRKGK